MWQVVATDLPQNLRIRLDGRCSFLQHKRVTPDATGLQLARIKFWPMLSPTIAIELHLRHRFYRKGTLLRLRIIKRSHPSSNTQLRQISRLFRITTVLWGTLFLFLAIHAHPAHAQESPYFVTYDHYLEEPGSLEVEYSSLFSTQRAGN